VVALGGTYGTLTGIGRFFKDNSPSVKIVGVHPYLDIEQKTHTIMEGVNSDLVFRVTDHSIIDEWKDVSDKEAFDWTR